MNQNILISLIIPVYNVKDYLDECIKSIQSQTYKNFEAIFIDDGSTDGSSSLLDHYISKDARFKVYHQENQGVSKARQFGLDQASGKYVFFLDADDWMHNDLLTENVKIAEQTQSEVVLFGANEVQNGKILKERSPNTRQTYTGKEIVNQFNHFIHENNMNCLWNKLYLLSFLKENNIYFPNLKVGEDALFNIEVYKKLNRLTTNPKKYYYYRMDRDGSAMNSFRFERIYEVIAVRNGYYSLFSSWEADVSVTNNDTIDLLARYFKQLFLLKMSVNEYLLSCKKLIKLMTDSQFLKPIMLRQLSFMNKIYYLLIKLRIIYILKIFFITRFKRD